MSSNPFNGMLPSTTTGAVALRTALAAFSILTVTAGSLLADTAGQTAIEAQLQAHSTAARAKTITLNNATAAQLAAAVADAIPANPSLTAADLAESAIQPITVTVGPRQVIQIRADRNISGPAVAAAAINELISTGTDATFAADAAAITDGVVDVNFGVATQVLTLAGQEAVVKAALGTISNASVLGSLNSTDPLAAADSAIGNAIATDPDLIPLTKNGLTTLLETAIAGVTGTKGTSTAAAPLAAESFVAGILTSGTVPDNATYPTFAQAILAKVAVNSAVDELVSYQIGLKDTVGDLPNVAEALFLKYPLVEAKITQGLAAAIPAGTNDQETARITFVNSTIATAGVKYATATLEGAVFTDPYFAGQFTGDVLTDIFNSTTATRTTVLDTGHALVVTDAPLIASGVGAILGTDGDALTQVSGSFSDLIASGALPVANAALYANDLITGAVKSKLPASEFSQITAGSDGGTLAVGVVGTAKITEVNTPMETVKDLESIEDLFASAIVTKDDATIDATKAGATAAATQLGTLAKDIATFVKGDVFTPVLNGPTVPVAQYLAGTLAQFVVNLGLDTTVGTGAKAFVPQTVILAAIEADLKLISTAAVNADITTAVNSVVTSGSGSGTYQIFGEIDVPETTITNL
jgi:hypothetical protein